MHQISDFLLSKINHLVLTGDNSYYCPDPSTITQCKRDLEFGFRIVVTLNYTRFICSLLITDYINVSQKVKALSA